MKVRIERVHVESKYKGWYEVRVYVDDKLIGSGSVGAGEVEDNSIHRDYDWIVPLLEKLSCAILYTEVQVVNMTERDEY